MSYIMKVRLELTLFLSVCMGKDVVWVGGVNGVACVCWAGMPLLCLLHSSLIVICWIPVFCGPACLLFFFLSLYRVKVSLTMNCISLKKSTFLRWPVRFLWLQKSPSGAFHPTTLFPCISSISQTSLWHIKILKCYRGLITCFWRNL